MKGLALGLSLSVAFILGCAAAPIIVPRMSAQEPVGQRWAHLCLQARSAEQLTALANQAGAQGWEMVGVGATDSTTEACFKHPL